MEQTDAHRSTEKHKSRSTEPQPIGRRQNLHHRSTSVRNHHPLDPDGYARAVDDGHAMHVSREEIAEILQIINGVDNLFMQQHIVPSHQRMVMAVHLRKREGRGRWTSKASRVHRRFKLIRPFKDKGGMSLIHSVFGQAVKAKHLREFSVQDLACVQAVDVKLFKMESGMKMKVAVTFKGSNYLVWSRMVKNAVGSKGLWKHITSGEAPMAITQGALVTYTGALNPRGNDQDFIRRSEMDALIKMLKDNGLIVKLELSITLIEMLG
ncbi:hypothetical protein F2Q68_00015316 [Brassica cretica]|uniref:Uncharacterized protein n=1 Tax=Brassica cretica TaxID=69181 RepID=A0A8S9HKN7_BRACR|nr:hypothetical protein F2Q68_00015316 [Brassica cretica]